MTEGISKELLGMTADEKAAAWEDWVRSEVNAALDIYLSRASSSNINIRYFPVVVEELETGPVLDETTAKGVLISIELLFENPIDLNKSMTDE